MKAKLLVLGLLATTLTAFGSARAQNANEMANSGVEDLSKPNGIEPPMLGIHWVRGNRVANPTPTQAGNLESVEGFDHRAPTRAGRRAHRTRCS